MDMIKLIYASRPFGFDDAILSGILIDARRCNKRDDITGALVCRHDIYLQMLEGPSDKVEAAYQRILRDDRHANLTKLVSRPIDSRLFAGWDMLHDPAQSWHWTAQDVAAGRIAAATEDDICYIFERLAEKAKAGSLT